MRKKARKETAETLINGFSPNYPLVVHWDGKILPEILGSGKVDRLPVLVSGDGMEKLLGVPNLTSGTWINKATVVYEMFEQWNLTNNVAGLNFDTTAVNTDQHNRMCEFGENAWS